MDAAKALKCMRGSYEKVRPVSQKVGIRRPVSQFVEWPLVGSHPLLFGALRIDL